MAMDNLLAEIRQTNAENYDVKIVPIDKQNIYATCFQGILCKMKRVPRKVRHVSWTMCFFVVLGFILCNNSYRKLISCLFLSTVAIDCYYCASLQGDHQECEDVFARDLTTEHWIARDCMTGYWKGSHCIKLKGKRMDGTSILIRQCAVSDWGSHCGLIEFDAKGNDNFEDIDGCLETCDYDGCNLATTPFYSIAIIISSVTFCLLQMST